MQESTATADFTAATQAVLIPQSTVVIAVHSPAPMHSTGGNCTASLHHTGRDSAISVECFLESRPANAWWTFLVTAIWPATIEAQP